MLQSILIFSCCILAASLSRGLEQTKKGNIFRRSLEKRWKEIHLKTLGLKLKAKVFSCPTTLEISNSQLL